MVPHAMWRFFILPTDPKTDPIDVARVVLLVRISPFRNDNLRSSFFLSTHDRESVPRDE